MDEGTPGSDECQRLLQQARSGDPHALEHLLATHRAYLRHPALPFRLWLRRLAEDRLGMLWRFHFKAARRSVAREIVCPEESSLRLMEQLASTGSTPSQELSREEQARDR